MLDNVKRTKLECGWCKKEFFIKNGELNRQLKRGRSVFYCCLKCGGYGNNPVKIHKSVVRECAYCKNGFTTLENKDNIFCSKPCAAKGSISDKSRESSKRSGKLNFHHMKRDMNVIARGLLTRENWKYEKLKNFLDEVNVKHVFELPLGDFVFDLALVDEETLIEFDGAGHNRTKDIMYDKYKERYAVMMGWKLVRLRVGANTVIPEDCMFPVLGIDTEQK